MTQAVEWNAYETPRRTAADRGAIEPAPALRERLYLPLREAARGLGWSGPCPNSTENVERLLRGGRLAMEAILDEVATCSREEVLHEAAEVLAKFAETSALVAELGRVIVSVPTPVKRAVAVRALGYLPGASDERLQLLTQALADRDPEVRDRAALALGATRDVRALEALERAFADETIAIVRESIADALEALRS